MRPEKLYLLDIIEAAEAIQRFCHAINEDCFVHDELRQSAILQKLIIIGEAASRLSKEFQDNHADIEWQDIIGFRNIAVHEYFAVLWSIVWNTAIYDIPIIKNQLSKILANEYLGDE